MTIEVEISLYSPEFSYCEHIPRNGFAGSYSNTISNLLRSHHTVFCSDHDSDSVLKNNHQGEGKRLDSSVMLLKTDAVVVNH